MYLLSRTENKEEELNNQSKNRDMESTLYNILKVFTKNKCFT